MDKHILQKLISEGLTMPQIGKKIGKSPSAVYRLLKKFDLKTKRHADVSSEEFKLCRYCDTKKSCKDFPRAAKIGNKVYFRHKCNACYTKMKSDRRSAISNWIAEKKKKLHCNICGNKDFRVLEFHHRDQDKKEFNIGEHRGRSIKTLQEEIKKCDILCANCHRIVTYESRNNPSLSGNS